MKLIYTLILTLLFFPGEMISQQESKKVLTVENKIITYKKVIVYKWEGVTASGIRVFGVQSSYIKAVIAIDDFQKEKRNTRYALFNRNIKTEIIDYSGEEDYFNLFYKRCPEGYRYLSARDLAAIDIIKRESMERAVEFYSSASKKEKKEIKRYLKHLYYNLIPYRISMN